MGVRGVWIPLCWPLGVEFSGVDGREVLATAIPEDSSQLSLY